MLSKKFKARLNKERTIDTVKYRYRIHEYTLAGCQVETIERISLDKLGTTAVIDGWETVEVLHI